MHGLDGLHQDVDRTPMEESIRMTEDRDKWRKYVHGVATLGLRMVKEQDRTSTRGPSLVPIPISTHNPNPKVGVLYRWDGINIYAESTTGFLQFSVTTTCTLNIY